MSSYPVNGVITFLPPPEGYVVDFNNPQQQDALKHFLIFGILGSLAIFCLLQRLYVKYYITRGLKIDDDLFHRHAVGSNILLLFGCQPRETAWDPYLFATGKCIDYAVMYIIIAVANIISDIVLFAIPMPMIVRLKIPLGQKIGLGIMLSIATIDAACSEPPSSDSLQKVQRKKHTGYTQFDTCGSLELATYPDTMSSSSETAYAMESLHEQRCGTDSPPDTERQEDVSQSPTDSLPPTDRGYSVSFGIFQEYYSRPGSPISTASSGTIATIGALQQGVMYLMMPFAFLILTRYPRLRHLCGPLGLAVTVASLTASAFVNTVAGLIATQGALYSIGCGLLFCPISHYMNEWFVERKGMALGVMWAGKSGTGIAMPFVFDALLRRIGLKATLLAWAGASAAMTLPTLVFIKPRIPLHTQVQVQPLSFRFLRHTSFWMMQAGVIIQSLGYLMPSTYLASYASTIGLPSITGPILLALFSVASVPGGIVHGMLGDKFSATKAVTIASIGSALPIWLLWGLSLDLANLVVFVIVYGFFAGGFSSTWSNMSTDIQKDDSAADSALIFGMLMGGRGIGFVTAGPLSGALLQAKAHLSNEALGYATQYGPMIICTGVTAVFGAWAPIWKGMRVALGTCKSR
ncbi:hypothetical protein FOXG_16597 [Fusarium oxysporum f. sp. lycopersici 4287]|uniref:Rhodopsin domain-containing protein n=2 Tax=Fusarium oxysporum TaxID=5507 RepID=A0A0J9W9J2_FUSO4|nr:hypothetical protein FOXG_16597 [Fusarium oxysporum f. sp. lycopersici 4287]KNB19171.1 hypothetical protein FOXG_16597 [Fusarium oxysporum f. sp. lycopersici 4287]